MSKSAIEVLIVEDERSSRLALKALLKSLKFKPIAVGDLAGARAALAQSTPEILILDLLLPDGDGTELLAEIRRAGKPIRVAVVTAVTDRLRLHEVTAWNPEALFGKPIDVNDFDDWLVKQRDDFSAPSGGVS